MREAGYIAMSGQILDSTLITAPSQRNTDVQKAAIKAGKAAAEIWSDEPNKAAQKDTHARWTVKFGKARQREDSKTLPDIAIPSFGYKAHASIDRRHRLIRRWVVTDAAAHDGRMLRRGLLDTINTGSGVWAESAYRPKKNEGFVERIGLGSHIHRRRSPGKPMPLHIRRRNAARSKHRAPIEHVFAVQKHAMALTIRTIGLGRAKTKIGVANITYKIQRLIQIRRAEMA